MSEATQSVRVDNIKKARDAWQLKMDGVEILDISEKLSITANTIHDIFEYTNFSYYSIPSQELSYYDTKLMVLEGVSKKREKLKEINATIAYKQNIFFNLLKITFALMFFIIII